MGRRRRRVIKVVKKKLPSVFTCPSCGEESIRVKLPQGSGPATVQCGACGLKREFEATPSSQIVDIYCKFTDEYYSKEKPTEAPNGRIGRANVRTCPANIVTFIIKIRRVFNSRAQAL